MLAKLRKRSLRRQFAMTALFVLSACGLSTAQEINHIDAEGIRAWMEEGRQFRILDVRTVAEFHFVGHPVGAVNVPLRFWDWVSGMQSNPDFLEDVNVRFGKDETIAVICRSGGRSERAVEMLTEAGFKSVFNFVDGFEGPVGENGQRNIAGWRASGLPTTYEADPEQTYKPLQKEDFKDP